MLADIENDSNLIKPLLSQLKFIPEMLEDEINDVEDELAEIEEGLTNLENPTNIV